MWSTQFTSVSTSENKIPRRSDWIENAGTIVDARRIIAPLITKENSPRVTTLIGIETIINTGLIVWLMIAKTIATVTATPSVESDVLREENISGTPTDVR